MRRTPPPTHAIRAVFCDVDGVLLDSLAAHLRMCEDKSLEYGLKLRIPSASEFKEMARRGVRISPMKCFFRAVGFSEGDAERADAQYQAVFATKYTPAVFPGVPDLLEGLRRSGLTLGFVTANVKRNVETALGPLLNFFDPRCRFTDDHPARLSKAAALKVGAREVGTSSQQVLYVGDQGADWAAAREADTRFLGVTYGWGISDEDVGFPKADSPQSILSYVTGTRGLAAWS